MFDPKVWRYLKTPIFADSTMKFIYDSLVREAMGAYTTAKDDEKTEAIEYLEKLIIVLDEADKLHPERDYMTKYLNRLYLVYPLLADLIDEGGSVIEFIPDDDGGDDD